MNEEELSRATARGIRREKNIELITGILGLPVVAIAGLVWLAVGFWQAVAVFVILGLPIAALGNWMYTGSWFRNP